MPDQFQNPANPLAHERGTGPEILEQLAGKEIHAFVAAIGTGGTISGVGRSLRRVHSECAIVGVEPENSQVIQGKGAGPHKIQGIGAGFIPGNLDRRILSEMRSVSDRNAFDMARRLAKEEGLLVGLSAGANVHIACQFAQELGPDKRVVTILCDTGERYFSVDDSFH